MVIVNAAAGHPEVSEYPPYYERYISLIPKGDILTTLAQQLETTLALFRSIPESRADSRYAPDKWSIKELIGHLIDTERILAY
ncbi:MAG: DinB family protein, partial [Acidobacteria bacterium]|nr:DinB family protein [Acidobacteriota bacterium]